MPIVSAQVLNKEAWNLVMLNVGDMGLFGNNLSSFLLNFFGWKCIKVYLYPKKNWKSEKMQKKKEKKVRFQKGVHKN